MSFWSYDKKAICCMRENAYKIGFILLPLGGDFGSHVNNVITNVENFGCTYDNPNEVLEDFVWAARKYVEYVIKTYYKNV
jgi:hypothetical protein